MHIIRFVALFFAMSASGLSGAEENQTGNEMLNKYGADFVLSASESLMDAKVEASCLKQITAHGETYIANKEKCATTVNALLTEIDEISKLTSYRKRLESFKREYQLF